MLDSIVQKATDNFIEEIRKSNIYREYVFQKEKLKKDPVLFDGVTEFRQRNFVDGFLQAELAFCRMMQEVNVLVTAELDFE